MTDRQCTQLKRDGMRCRMRGNLRDTATGPVCIWHDPDPERRNEAQQLRLKGGDNRKESRMRVVTESELPPDPRTQLECEDYLRWVIRAVATGKLDAITGRTMETSIRSLHTTIGNRDGLERRVKDLTKQLADMRRKRGT